MLRKLYLIWWGIAIIISCFVLFSESVRLYDFLTNDFVLSYMRVDKVIHSNNSSERKSIMVKGRIKKKEVYFSAFDEDINHVRDYINNLNIPIEEKLNYKRMKNLNLLVPVIQFKHSTRVLLIPNNHTKNETLKNWYYSKLFLFSLAYLPLIFLFFMTKKTTK